MKNVYYMMNVKNNYDVYTGTDEARQWLDNFQDPLNADEEVFISQHLKDRSLSVLDCGCGSGRISFNIEKKGFKNVVGFDFSMDMVERARQSSLSSSNIRFYREDVTQMSIFGDESYDYILYLQQIISIIPYDKVSEMLCHARRVVKPGGIILFSALNMDGRKINYFLASILSVVRRLTKNKKQKQMLPWLFYGGKINWRFWMPNQPTNYWFHKSEFEQMLKAAGFSVLKITTSSEILKRTSGNEGYIYAACTKT
jgi:ubiquinone/menaquinone biosynthesis C-methylase UbiE